MGKILTEYIQDCRNEYAEEGLLFNPSSIYHGCKIARMSDKMCMKIRMSMLEDFIEFLFENSEHCDHISQSDAWKEYDEWYFKNIVNPKK